MTAPAVSAATTATRPTAGASGMNGGVQLPVTALVTVSSVTAPAAAPVPLRHLFKQYRSILRRRRWAR
jgi:hypothetical protein